MVVRLDLAEDVDVFLVHAVLVGLRVDVEASAGCAGEHGGVVLVGGENAFAVQLVRILDHLEQRLVLWLSVDVPGGVENFVAAVLGVGLREHHQLDVVWIAAEGGEGFDEVIDLILRERETEVNVGRDECRATGGEHRHAVHRARCFVAEERGASGEIAEDHLGHAIVELGAEGLLLPGIDRREGETGAGTVGADIDGVGDHALDAFDGRKSADVGDVSGF